MQMPSFNAAKGNSSRSARLSKQLPHTSASIRLMQKFKTLGIRLTSQRIELGRLLFEKESHHFSAETLYAEAQKANIRVSLATVYNCLHYFTKRGLLRSIVVDGSQVIYDTNTDEHTHFLCTESNEIIDIPEPVVTRNMIRGIPDGMDVLDIQVVIKIRRNRTANTCSA